MATSGQARLLCPNIPWNCLFDLEGSEFNVGEGHLTANENFIYELGGALLCPPEGFLDALLETLTDAYILG